MTVYRVPSGPAERRDWVIGILKRKGTSLRQIAQREGVTPQSVSQALMMPSARLEPVLAAEVGVPVQVLFPERYRPDGTRLCRTRPVVATREAA